MRRTNISNIMTLIFNIKVHRNIWKNSIHWWSISIIIYWYSYNNAKLWWYTPFQISPNKNKNDSEKLSKHVFLTSYEISKILTSVMNFGLEKFVMFHNKKNFFSSLYVLIHQLRSKKLCSVYVWTWLRLETKDDN